jgi:hypothetical protein
VEELQCAGGLTGRWTQDNNNDQYSSFGYFAFGIPALFVGAICFFLADWIVRLAYRKVKTG